MANFGSNFQLLVFCGSLFILICSLRPALCSLEKHFALFIFGDSLFDAGNNNYFETPYKANFFPYGETFFRHPTGRSCDGRIIPDFIAEYAKLPFIPPYLDPNNNYLLMDGINFASSGAGVLVETHQGDTIDLKTQLKYFKKVEKQLRKELGKIRTKKWLSGAVFLFSVGTNDYASTFPVIPNPHQVEMVIGNLTKVIKEIYKKGGRKFGFVSLGAIGCLPSMRAKNSTGGCQEKITVLVKRHNKALSEALKELQSQLHGFKYANFDFYSSLRKRINNPSKYGFKEVKAACCGSGPYGGTGKCGGERKEYKLCDDPKKYLFFDAHPSEKANKQFAKLMWDGGPHVTKPYNLKQLFQAKAHGDSGSVWFG
ncbi:hypothetical protein JCGZ_24644 [Jatropha curcas]|uniref:GDSL esterase/lipase 1-like n=4 Tax=Jatropha curcas TaxID=180498 RepID=A0A067L821_JATCU|nr:hypothetical protein JCGZ_24644 [Jatropha curcas]